MKVGDYVRYAKWNYKEKSQDVRIAKIKDIQTETGYNQKFIFFENGNGEYEDYIIKSSPNIIDLIEVGDYVNGRYVDKYQGKLGNFCELPNGKWEFVEISNKHYLISSIVTKEAFENMEYKVDDKK